MDLSRGLGDVYKRQGLGSELISVLTAALFHSTAKH
jgi:hypothetical protein